MPRCDRCFLALKLKLVFLAGIFVVALSCVTTEASHPTSDTEYTGNLDGELVPHTEDKDQVFLHALRDRKKIKFATPLETGANVTAGRLYDPLKDKSSLLALLVESEGEPPILYADLDGDGLLADSEKFEMTRDEDDNPYIRQVTLQLPFKNPLFKTYPIFIQYYKDVRWDELKENDRL